MSYCDNRDDASFTFEKGRLILTAKSIRPIDEIYFLTLYLLQYFSNLHFVLPLQVVSTLPRNGYLYLEELRSYKRGIAARWPMAMTIEHWCRDTMLRGQRNPITTTWQALIGMFAEISVFFVTCPCIERSFPSPRWMARLFSFLLSQSAA